MAKTTFQNGVVVQPEYLNALYVTDGGHKHDGADADGHAGKINLQSEVEGLLLRDNFDHFHEHDDVSESKINLASHVTGTLPTENYADHNHNGIDKSKIHPYLDINGVSEGEFSINLFGFSTAVQFTAHYRLDEYYAPGRPKMASIAMPYLLEASISMSMDTDSETPVPEDLRPNANVCIPITVYNYTEYSGAVKIYADGRIKFLITHVLGSQSSLQQHLGIPMIRGSRHLVCSIQFILDYQ